MSLLSVTVPKDLLAPLIDSKNNLIKELRTVVDYINIENHSKNLNMILLEDVSNTTIREYGESECIASFDDMLVYDENCDYFCSVILLIVLNKEQCVGGNIILTKKKCNGKVLFLEEDSSPNVLIVDSTLLCCTSEVITKGTKIILRATVLIPSDASIIKENFLMVRFSNSRVIRSITRQTANKHPGSIFSRKWSFNDSNVLFLSELKFDDFSVILRAIDGNLEAFNKNQQLMDFLGITYNNPIGITLMDEFNVNVALMEKELYKKAQEIDDFLLTKVGLVNCYFAKSYLEYVTMKQLFEPYGNVVPIQLLYGSYDKYKKGPSRFIPNILLNVSIWCGLPIYLNMIFGEEAYYYGDDNIGINSKDTLREADNLSDASIHLYSFIRYKRLMGLFNKVDKLWTSELNYLLIECMQGNEQEYIENYMSICSTATKELVSNQTTDIPLVTFNISGKEPEYIVVKDKLVPISNIFREEFNTNTEQLSAFFSDYILNPASVKILDDYYTKTGNKKYFKIRYESYYGFIINNK